MKKAPFAGLILTLVSSTFVVPSPAKTRLSDAAVEQTAAAPVAHERVGLENFDLRRDPETRALNSAASLAGKHAPVDRSAALSALFDRAPLASPEDLIVDLHDSGIPKTVAGNDGFLTAPRSGSPDRIAREFLAENSALFGLSPAEVADLEISMNDLDETTGVTFLKYEQTVGGVPVYDSEIGVTITARGEVVVVNQGQTIPGAALSARPTLDPEQAIAKAFEHCGVEVAADAVRPSAAKRDGASAFTYFANPLGESREDVAVRKTVVDVHGDAVLAYRALVDAADGEWYDTLVDASTGELLVRANLAHDVQGSVFTRNPNAARTTVNFAPQFGVADPWIASGTLTKGNNANAYVDADRNGTTDPTTTGAAGPNAGLTGGYADAAKGSPAGQFSFAWSAASAPAAQQAASVTNLFYFCNAMHDWMYSLGFTESARNAQVNNYGRGGEQGDAVIAAAQGSPFTNNASTTTPPDGISPRVETGNFTYTTPSRDSGLDGDVVMHEYGHVVSERLIGDSGGLEGVQSGAMGEGWSDYWACSNYDDGVVGEYVTGNPNGIRRAAYTVPANPIHDSYADLGNGPDHYEIHYDGEIWAATLWDLNRTLGKAKADKLVLDGMKNTPTSPSMVSARTGIITACQTLYPADVCTAWTVFARHGLGYSARGTDSALHVAATDLAPSCVSCSSSTTPITPGASLSGTLSVFDCTSTIHTTPSCYYDNFTFQATFGTVYTVTLDSTQFDAFLYVLDGTTRIGANDNDGSTSTLNSKVTFASPVTGPLTIHCTSRVSGATGAYTVGLKSGSSVLSEGAESGAPGWTKTTNVAGNTWIVSPDGRNTGSFGFRTSNGSSPYANNLDQTLVSPAFSLVGKTNAWISFTWKTQLESLADTLVVELSKDGGATWSQAGSASSVSPGFTTTPGQGMTAYRIQLGTSYLGKSGLKFRFHLKTNGANAYWGAAVDDIVVSAS